MLQLGLIYLMLIVFEAFIVSGNGIDFDPSTHSSGATYNSALGF